MKITSCLLVGCSLLAVTVPLHAQPASPGAAATVSGAPPATAAATQPATTQAKRYEITIPPGFKLIEINARKVIVEPPDEAWVTTALGKVAATTRPATQPAHFLARLGEHRTELLTQIARDLALSDLASAAAIYDNDLTGAIRQLDQYHPPIFYLVISPQRLNEIMRAGWTDQRFYYNRAADSVSFNPAGALNIDRQDDVIFPAVYDSAETPEKRAENLTVAVASTEASVATSLEVRGKQIVGATFAQLVNKEALEPLALKEDQAWYTLGVASWLSAKYAAVITGEKREELNNLLTFEHPANPLKTTAIDLLHPTDLNTMRREALPAYFDTVRRKSTRAIKLLVDQKGEEAIAKSLVLIRQQKPQDGPALVKTIQEATGVDLTSHLVRGS